MKCFVFFIVFFNSLLYAQDKEPVDSISFYNKAAQTNILKNNYKNAIDYTQKAINYSEANSDKLNQAIQTFHLGKIYYDLNKNNDATHFLTESITLFENFPISVGRSEAYYYLGLTKSRKGDFNTATIYFNKSEQIKRALKIPDDSYLINLQKAIIFREKGNLEKSKNLFNAIITLPTTVKNSESKTEAYYQMGLIESDSKRNNFALNYFNKAYELSTKDKNLQQRSNILLALSYVHEKMLEKNKAYAYLKQHLNLKESIDILNNQKLGIDDYENFKETQRLKNIERINKQNVEKQKTNKFSKLINILAVALISILSLLSLSLYKNNIIRNKTNLLLKEKNNELILEKEKTEKASKARSEFLSTVSHELRTPLNAINGITHLLMEENPKKSQLHYLSSLKFSGNYLSTFINEILEINKIESNKIEIENISFNLKELLEDIKNSLNGLAKTNNNNFTLQLDSYIPDSLVGDPTKLSQIFMNLINNALKFTKDGSVTVTTKTNILDNKKAHIYFTIIDTGIGISKDKLETVFESFSQGSVEINRKYGGTGLGLTIVKKLIEILGGTIQLSSELGKGSTFYFDLEFDINNDLKADLKQSNSDYAILKNKKFLVVEDNKINQMITTKMLENKGVICTIIDNGEEAIKNIKDNSYDMVLMDVHLPGINGTIATREIRKSNEITPIIAITAISLDENREMLLSFGMNDVVTKPFAPEDFYNVIMNNMLTTSKS
ncbi:signal transduction histidine kinase/CheY-like chemotaxis protein [Flavobacterium sp. 7E]|uniref:tetratricopeptide repeat-containing hybrid sensor histidine kinase/response regulator n=1 Tax=Flavobacterium sp. 7E TaxID=2735898 RepID=UPI00156E69CF|nr:ATP-binding protein [Flavobacterium sp. 7E]NRS89240.1 signal transduction histidine kinase/CheY-like chemotaxis protein [Flavobacterium sp. 7E]